MDRVQVEGEAARAGLFRGLVLCLVENKRVDEWIAETLARPEVKCISNIEEVLQVWAAPLKQILEDSNRIPENSEWSGRVRIPGMVYDAMIEEFEHRSKAAKKAG